MTEAQINEEIGPRSEVGNFPSTLDFRRNTSVIRHL